MRQWRGERTEPLRLVDLPVLLQQRREVHLCNQHARVRRAELGRPTGDDLQAAPRVRPHSVVRSVFPLSISGQRFEVLA